MANLRRWSTTATGNASVSGGVNTINFAEGQTPGSVNNSAREMMAQIRGIYTPSEWGWVENSATVSVASQTTFKLANNQTTDWTAGRRWRLKSGSTTRYGSVVSSSYTTETTITVTVDSGSLSASHSLAALSPIDASSNQLPLAQQSFLRNRIINGDFRIDQRNAGSPVNPSGTTYTLDRWRLAISQSSKLTVSRYDGPTATSPAFEYYGGVSVATAVASPAASDFFLIEQIIEANNVTDLAGKAMTLSFWVNSATTGTYGVAILINTRWCLKTYTVSAANTWEYKTLTFPVDGSATAPIGTGQGARVVFDLGCGSNFETASTDVWGTTQYLRTSSCVRFVSSTSNMLRLTGVQLESGSTATAFERRQYGHELALCQRYYLRLTGANQAVFGSGQVSGANTGVMTINFPVPMRTAPTALEQSGTASNYKMFNSTTVYATCTSVPTFLIGTPLTAVVVYTSTTLAGTAGQATAASTDGTGYLGWSAEL